MLQRVCTEWRGMGSVTRMIAEMDLPTSVSGSFSATTSSSSSSIRFSMTAGSIHVPRLCH